MENNKTRYLESAVADYIASRIKVPGAEYEIPTIKIERFKSFDDILSSINNYILMVNRHHKKYRFICIEDKERDYITKLTEEYIGNSCKKKMVFVHFSGYRENAERRRHFDKKEATDRSFVLTRLLRDLVIKDNTGFEIDCSRGKVSFEEFLDLQIKKISGRNKAKSRNLLQYPEHINKILGSFNNYYSCDLTRDQLFYILPDLYSMDSGSAVFRDIDPDRDLLQGLRLGHIKIGHNKMGDVQEVIRKSNKNNKKANQGAEEVGNAQKWNMMTAFLSSFVKTLAVKPSPEDAHPIIHIIDDDIQDKKFDIDLLKDWFGKTKVKIKSDMKEIAEYFEGLQNPGRTKIEPNPRDFDFFIIDIDYAGEQLGFDYLRILRDFKDNVFSKPYIIVLSQLENPESIQKALRMGALMYASKQNIGDLINQIYQVWPLIKKFESNAKKQHTAYLSGAQNWSLLEMLPPQQIIELKTDKITGKAYSPIEEVNGTPTGGEFKDLQHDDEYKWISKFPKAELHCHIGSSFGYEVFPLSALIVLSELNRKRNKGNAKINCTTIKKVIDFIFPVVTDPYLVMRSDHIELNGFCNNDCKWQKLKKDLSLDEDLDAKDSIFDIISDSLNLKAIEKLPEEVLLSPDDRTIEQKFPFGKLKKTDYYKNKKELRRLCITYDEVMLHFILLIDIHQSSDFLNSKDYLARLRDKIMCDFPQEQFSDARDNNKYNLVLNSFRNAQAGLDEFIETYSTILLDYPFPQDARVEHPLKQLSSANSLFRCLPRENRGLFHYLRGCEYGGAPHLQSPASIFLVARYIVKDYALKNNIRYLDLRCAVDGYNKLELHDNKEKIMDSVIQSFDFWTQYFLGQDSNNKTHINLIITAKRHKAIKQFEENINLAQQYGVKRQQKDLEREVNINKFFKSKTQVVSFDIAGYEKNNRVSKFIQQLQPLLKSCFPVTIHAGEEDDHEAIWEAVYLAHSQRLGHALSLSGNRNLLSIVRERHIHIELCPISNYLTNHHFAFEKEDLPGRKEYPLHKYMEEGLSVSINTDNPCVSDSDPAKEFLFAAKLSGKLTKWEILKIILESFKSISIHKRLKRVLIQDINEEIFKILLDEKIRS